MFWQIKIRDIFAAPNEGDSLNTSPVVQLVKISRHVNVGRAASETCR